MKTPILQTTMLQMTTKGSGKTQCTRQMIEAYRAQGHAVVVIDDARPNGKVLRR